MKCDISYPQDMMKWSKEAQEVLFAASYSTVSKLGFCRSAGGFWKQYHVIPDGEGKMNMGKQRDVFYL